MASKNNPSNKKQTQKSNLVLSSECEKCAIPCERGKSYLANMKKGKTGKGVVCHKNDK